MRPTKTRKWQIETCFCFARWKVYTSKRL